MPFSSQVRHSEPCPFLYTLKMPTSALLSSQIQTFDVTDYRYRPESFLNCIMPGSFYQLAPEATNSEQCRI